MNISLVFLTQRLYVNDESFRQISQNCDYFAIFKNPSNSSEIRTIAQQMTPGNMILVPIYMDATKGPFSYLFINLTQECGPQMTYMWGDLYLLGEHIDQLVLRVPGVGRVQVWGASQRARAQLSNKEVL